jgi:hypothetical protein
MKRDVVTVIAHGEIVDIIPSEPSVTAVLVRGLDTGIRHAASDAAYDEFHVLVFPRQWAEMSMILRAHNPVRAADRLRGIREQLDAARSSVPEID